MDGETSTSREFALGTNPSTLITPQISKIGTARDEDGPEAAGSSSSSVSLGPRSTSLSLVNTSRDLELHPVVVSRLLTQRQQHAITVGNDGTSKDAQECDCESIPAIGHGKPMPPSLPEEAYVVEFDGPDDPLHPLNWPLRKKILIAVILSFTTLLAAFGSSIFSTAILPISKIYGVSPEVSTLGVSLYVFGFAFGPILWAPLSELYGRRLPIVVSMFGFTIFQAATATAVNLQTIMLGRFFGGLFGASSLTVVPAVFSDIFDDRTRGTAIALFSMMVFAGPILAPFVGGFIVQNPYLGWRWTEYLMTILGGVSFLLDAVFLDESYAPVVLISKASNLRKRTKNWAIHAKQEEVEVGFKELIQKNLTRPLRMLVGEPIILLLSIYMAFIYGLLYLSLTAYPIVFQGIHGFSPGVGGLPFFGMALGEVLATIVIILQQPSFIKKLNANHGVPIPEWRLPPVFWGGLAFAIGLFWFGWTGYRAEIPWIVPTLAGLALGYGLLTIFLQALNYIVDGYLVFAASAIAANTFLRSLAGAGFPLFAQYMYAALGVNWTGTVLGCVALLLTPVPVVFYKYGARLRQKSIFTPKPAHADGPSDEEKR